MTKLIKERPDLTTWWIAQENRIGEGTGATFRSDRPPYVELLKEAENPVMDDMFEDDAMSCFCHVKKRLCKANWRFCTASEKSQ